MSMEHDAGMPRREFLKLSAVTAGAIGVMGPAEKAGASPGEATTSRRKFNTEYRGEELNRIAFPMGGMGAGMICLEGSGALSHFSLRNKPEVFNEPCLFAAISVRGQPRAARVLEGPVPPWKIFGRPDTGNGAGGSSYGLPRFAQAAFEARLPFAKVSLSDTRVPLAVEITGWSPFEPGQADDSSLPVAALEYRFTNRSNQAVEAVFSYHARHFMALSGNAKQVRLAKGGFVLWGGPGQNKPWEEGSFAVTVDDPAVKVNPAWFRGGWFDALTMVWKDVADCACYEREAVKEGGPSPGASVFVPFTLAAGATKTIVVRLSWYVGQTDLQIGKDPEGSAKPGYYQPRYAGLFGDIGAVNGHWEANYARLRANAQRFSDCFYDSTLPGEVVEAVAANLTILKSPTVLRQADGRLWSWEGCGDNSGCCHGSCTHVWNYAQAIPHLFPDLERSLRETEFGPSQDAAGHQTFRSAIPIRPIVPDFHAAADGQLGGIMKVYRDWRVSGDTEWLRGLWPKVKQSLNYCIETWDPGHKGWVEEPHHNTYDIEFWGPDGMCTSFYLGALAAAAAMGKAMADDVTVFESLLAKGKMAVEEQLYNGEYFIQKIEYKNLKAKNPLDNKSMVGSYSTEAVALFEREGPKYQYGNGCLSDGVLGAWLAMVSGLGQIMDPAKVSSHLKSVHRYNFKADLSDHTNPQRPSYAWNTEGGLLLCTWPKGDALALPFVYSNEVWTGIEYQAASHLMLMGLVEEGLDIVRACRARYDGRVRNPFNEYECGHWYARAMASYALLQGLTGARYDAVDKILYLSPRIKGDFRSFFACAGGYGTVGMKDGKAFFDIKKGQTEVKEIRVM